MVQYEASQIAHVCHEANRAVQIINGEPVSPPWEQAPGWQRRSTLAGVQHALDGATPEDLHAKWVANKIEEGWSYGRVKDPIEKTHPCLLPYDKLPGEQLVKDRLFAAIVTAMADR